MRADFSPTIGYGRARLRRFPGWLAALGPGIIWMALAQGSGELIWWPYMTCFLAYAVLLPKGVVPEGWHLAAEQARFFEVAWGSFGRALFLVVAAAFLCDTWLCTADGVARVHLEMFRFYFWRDKPVTERRSYRLMIVILTGVTDLLLALGYSKVRFAPAW